MMAKSNIVTRLAEAIAANRDNPMLGSMTKLFEDAHAALTRKEKEREATDLTTTKAAYAQLRRFGMRINEIARAFALAHDERAKHIFVKDWNPTSNEKISVTIQYEISERDLRDDEAIDDEDRYDDRYEDHYAKRSMHLYFEDRWLWGDEWREEVERAALTTEIADTKREIAREEARIKNADESKAEAAQHLAVAQERLAKLQGAGA
jgi:hypothetical protein